MGILQIPASELNYPIPFISSPLFPILYLSLYNTQKHTPCTTNTIFTHYDYIIVGAGSAGSTLAARLSEIPCVTVLLLEAGKSPPIVTEIPELAKSFIGSDIDWNYFTAPQKRTGRLLNDQKIVFPLGKGIGGSSNINGMMYARGSRHIYDQWESQGANGWSYNHVLPYFKKMETNKGSPHLDRYYHGFNGPMTVTKPRILSLYKSAIKAAIYERGFYEIDSNGRYQKGFYDYQQTSRNGQRCSVGKAYLVPAENRPNLHIVKGAYVTMIVLERNRATGLQFTTSTKSFAVTASKEVILSAGAVNTPKILMLSGIGPKNHLDSLKIPLLANLPVGLNFQDHFGSFHVYYTDKFLSSTTEITNPRTIAEYIRARSGLMAIAFGDLYTAFLTNENNTSVDAIPDYQIYLKFLPIKGTTRTVNLKQKVYEQTFQPYENKSTIICASQYLRPKSRGFVKIQSTDPFQPPIIDPNYLEDDEDLKAIVEGLKECDRIANTSALKSLGLKPIAEKYPGCAMYDRNSEKYLICEVQSIGTTGYHPVGTAKMGSVHDPTTVVDSELRVKGIRSLRVIDASVIPILPNANTNAPVIMIAEKAADIIKRNIQCESEFFPKLFTSPKTKLINIL